MKSGAHGAHSAPKRPKRPPGRLRGNAATDEAVSNNQTDNKMNTSSTKIPAPYAIGRNGTGYITNIRSLKNGMYSAKITATGKAGQPLWSERRTFTAAQVGR